MPPTVAAKSTAAHDNPITRLVRVFGQPRSTADGLLVVPVPEHEYAELLTGRRTWLAKWPHPLLVSGPAYLMECQSLTYYPTCRYAACEVEIRRLQLLPDMVCVQISALTEFVTEKQEPYFKNADAAYHRRLQAEYDALPPLPQ